MMDAEARISWRLRHLAPRQISPRSDLVAGVAVVALLVQLLFAQVTLALVLCFLIVGRISRWRPLWLALPAAVGLGWLLAVGARPAVDGYLAGGGQVLAHLARPGPLLAKLRQLRWVAAAWRRWLPRQFPVALIVAAAQSMLIGVFGRAVRPWPYRPGGLVAARNFYLAATLRRGEVATSDGCCVGIVADAGTRAMISWRAAQAGMLCVSQDVSGVSATGRDMALAAIQHRKAVIMIDLAGDCGSCGSSAGTGGTCFCLGGCGTAERVAAECANAGAPLQSFDGRSAGYDPLSCASPARATNLIIAMMDWTEVSQPRRLLCANYLNAALAVIALTPADPVWPRVPLLDELPGLLTPGTLPARLARLSGPRAAAVGSLAARVAELAGQLGSDDAALRLVTAQLAGLRSAPLGQQLRPAADRAQISVSQTLADRGVARFALDRAVNGQPAVMIARLAAADVIQHLAERCDLGGASDCLIWINGCEVIEASQLGVLVELGARTGTVVVLGTAAAATAASLAAQVNVIAVRGSGPQGGGAGEFALLRGPGRPDELSLWIGHPQPAHVADCKVVR
jgi:hypothetical protein